MDALNLPEEYRTLLTTDDRSALLHAVPLWRVSLKHMARLLKHYRGRYNTVVGFQPTGWSMQTGAPTFHADHKRYHPHSFFCGLWQSSHEACCDLQHNFTAKRPGEVRYRSWERLSKEVHVRSCDCMHVLVSLAHGDDIVNHESRRQDFPLMHRSGARGSARQAEAKGDSDSVSGPLQRALQLQ